MQRHAARIRGSSQDDLAISEQREGGDDADPARIKDQEDPACSGMQRRIKKKSAQTKKRDNPLVLWTYGELRNNVGGAIAIITG